MKVKLFYLILYCICFQFVYPFENISRTDTCSNSNSFIYDKKHLIYEFGLNKTYSIDITEGDSVCDVHISDTNNVKAISTTCEKPPILKWAFETLDNELDNMQFVVDAENKFLYFNLFLYNNCNRRIIDSSSTHIINNEELSSKIYDLKTFLINLWISLYLQSPN